MARTQPFSLYLLQPTRTPAGWRSGKRHRLGAEIEGSIPGPVKSDTESATARQRCDMGYLRSRIVLALRLADLFRHSLHASAQYGEINENLIFTALRNKLVVECAKVQFESQTHNYGKFLITSKPR